MSATIEALVQAWGVSNRTTRELVASLLQTAWQVNRFLAVPATEPGFQRPEVGAVTPDSTAAQVRAALDLYDALTVRYQGIPLDVLFSVRRAAENVIPGWQAIERVARDKGGAELGSRVVDLDTIYRALSEQGLSIGRAVDSSALQVWLFARLQSVYRSAGGSDWWKWAAALGLAWYLGGDRK